MLSVLLLTSPLAKRRIAGIGSLSDAREVFLPLSSKGEDGAGCSEDATVLLDVLPCVNFSLRERIELIIVVCGG